MDKNDTIVTNIVIQAMKMEDTIKRQRIEIERLRSDKDELLIIISKMRKMLLLSAPNTAKQLELFNL